MRRTATTRDRRALALPLGALAALIVGCERAPAPSPTDAGPSPDHSTSAGASAHQAPRPPSRTPRVAPLDAADGGLLARRLPRIEYRGGPFLLNPKIVTVTFTKDDPKVVARLEHLGSTLTRSDWWREVVAGYCAKPDECIGEGSVGASVHLDEPLGAEVADSEIDALLLRTAKAGRLGTLDKNSLLLVYLPKGVGLRDATTSRYCDGNARAYHRSLEINGAPIAIAVLPRCGGESELTGTASHEILEATTNPFPASHGFAFVSGTGPSGFSAAGLEPVDPCGLVTMDGHWTTESGFVVHRAWSNREAALAHDPCVPSRPGQPYAMLVPRDGAVRLAHEGDAVTVDLDASTAGGPASWSVSAFDLSGYQAQERYVDVSLDKATVTAGDVVTLTIRALKMNPKQQQIVALVSTVGVRSHMWPLLVVMR